MNSEDVDLFEKISGQVAGVHDELTLLARKSPNDAVNSFKLHFVNSLLTTANDLLGASYRPFADFEEFDSDDVPQNSDVVFMLAQYRQCLENLRADNVEVHPSGWMWRIHSPDDPQADEFGMIYRRSATPKRLKG